MSVTSSPRTLRGLKMHRFCSTRLRQTILEMAYAGSSVHIACAFSIVEILAVLYRSILRYSAADPRWEARDYLVLSKGHGIMAQYACLHEIGWISDDELQDYFADGTRLKGLADCYIPGVEASCGSLGHGLSVGAGLALAAKRRSSNQNTFVIVGDGECNEGSIWEALLFAAHAELKNLIVIVDANGQQAMGTTDEVLRLGDLANKFRAFGFETFEANGHDEISLHEVLLELLNSSSVQPKALVAHTVKGYGVSFMADDNRWHYTRLNAESYEDAMTEVTAI
jgi:transketolase